MKLYDSLSREKVEFEPIDPPRVRIYVCGPTVYDSPHVGHARSAVAFDVARRYMEYKGYDVIFARNYTDIDDKMIKRANERGITIQDLAKKYIDEYERAMDALNVKPPVYAPRATHLIGDFISFIDVLITKGVAYETNGNVYFHVPAFPDYGKLGLKPQKEIDDVLRRDSEEFSGEKKDPRDFALWKVQKPGEPAWDSPWGKGRPGWHIECSVMSMKLLGETIDIHGGGKDLVFPHHENEIAQSEAFSGNKFCRLWMHNGFVTVNKEKMSKSLGNFFTVMDILKEYPPPALRMFLVSAQYRNPINFSRSLLDQSMKNWNRIKSTWLSLKALIGKEIPAIDEQPLDASAINDTLKRILLEFETAMDNDLNTPKALGAVFSCITLANESISGDRDEFLRNNTFKVLEAMLEVLGFDRPYLERHAREDTRGTARLDALVQHIIDERASERENKNWTKADEIREFLNSIGIELQDSPDGTTWTFKKKE
ncbi:MAG: cysteine--tRNA ligase [Promethearchaeota archaeon]